MDNKGLTLVEIIVSVLIISILAAGLFGALIGSKQFFNRSMHRMQAFNFAREALDNMRANPAYEYNDTPSMVPTIAADGSTRLLDAHQELDSIITAEIETETGLTNALLTYDVIAEPYTGSCKEVRVYVTWDETTLP